MKQVRRLIDGSYAVCDVSPTRREEMLREGSGWKYSHILGDWYRVRYVLAYRGSKLAEAHECARRAGHL